MDLLEENQKKTKAYVISALIWLVTAILGVFSFFAGRRIFMDTLSRFFQGNLASSTQNPTSLFNILVSFPMLFLAIAIIIGGFEYHLGGKNRVGSEESRRLFARTLSVELGFLLLALFI